MDRSSLPSSMNRLRQTNMTDSKEQAASTEQTAPRDNDAIATALATLADRLSERGANEHRVRAYRRAAETVRTTESSLADLLETEGLDALEQLPAIGEQIAQRIAGFLQTGRLQLLHRLRHDTSPVRLFSRVPGIGRKLAERIHAALPELETLEDLEVAAHDGRLRAVEGFGRQRVQQVRAQLSDMLKNHSSRRRGRSYRNARRPRPGRVSRSPDEASAVPSVETLLAADRQYRRRAERGDLRRIAPHRFNPNGEAWLPLMKTRLNGWAVTALFSNTGRAHELDKTDDWVVLYTRPPGTPKSQETQHTVVTETRGDLKGRRVVRGREGDCRSFYRRRGELTAA